MRIAFVSYEMPPESGGGGIGTYVDQVSHLLAAHGHDVSVFCGSAGYAEESVRNKVKIFRIREPDRGRFCETVVPYFSAMHAQKAFDVVEGPDYFADAVHIKRKYPRLPVVVKLHTPSFLLGYDPDDSLTFYQKTRIVFGAFRRLRVPVIPRSAPIMALEKEAIRSASVIAAPSRSIAELVSGRLGLTSKKIDVFPLPYSPSSPALASPVATYTNNVTFVGRLEVNKGILDFAQAVPRVIQSLPSVKFRLIGRDTPAPDGTASMVKYLRHQLSHYNDSLEFWGEVANDKVLTALSDTDLFVLPSHHDNFPLSCLEAMSAGRAIVGSVSGGMVDMLNNGECGVLVQPKHPEELASAIIHLMSNPAKRFRLGGLARQRILQNYSAQAVLPQQLGCYEEAIRLA